MASTPPTNCFANWPAAWLEVSGNDRSKFLHNMCTADVLNMEATDTREAFFTNVKGHVLAHTLLVHDQDTIKVLVFQDDATPLAAHLDRYVVREEVTLTPRNCRPTLVTGADAPPSPADKVWPFPLVGASAWIVEMSGANTKSPDMDEAFNALRVAWGWPLLGTDFGEGTLPQELNRDAKAISFNKGCYLGQETVARLDALGRVNKQIVGVEGANLSSGTELMDGDKLVGTVTTAARFDDRYGGIAMVRRGSNSVGTTLQTTTGEATVIAFPTAEHTP